MTLKDLQIGQTACISKVGGNGELRQHFLDMGIIPGTVITKIKTAPMGDPVEFDVSGYELTMRLDDAAKIEVEAECSVVECPLGRIETTTNSKKVISTGSIT